MTTLGAQHTLYRTHRARRTGFYHGVGAFSVLGSGPSLRPGPRPQGVSYVHHANLYIRNIIPIRAPAGLSRVQWKPLPGRARISHPPARPDLFHPTSGKKNSRKFAVASDSSTQRQPPDNRLCSTPLGSKHPDLVAVVAPMCINEL